MTATLVHYSPNRRTNYKANEISCTKPPIQGSCAEFEGLGKEDRSGMWYIKPVRGASDQVEFGIIHCLELANPKIKMP